MPYPDSTYEQEWREARGRDEDENHLIDAAPEMLNALREARWTLIALYEKAYPDDEEDNDATDTIDLVLKAIASAEGRE